MADPATDYASISLLQVEDDRGLFVDLEDAGTLDYEMTKDRKVVQTMNRRRRGRGYQSANIAITGTVEVPIRRGEPEYDFERALIEDRVLQIYVERDDGGKRFILADVMVTAVGNSTNPSGDAMHRVSFTAIDVFPDASQVLAG